MRFVIRILFAALVLGVTACDASPTRAPTAPPPPLPLSGEGLSDMPPPPTSVFVEATPHTAIKISGQFVFAAGDGSLLLQDAAGGTPATLVERSTESIAQMPAFTPNGKHVVYSAMLFLPDGNLRGDLRRANLDGTGTETILRAESYDEVYFYPRPAPDGRWLVTRTERMQLEGERSSLEWINFESGTHTPVVQEARDGDVSADGMHIAFVRAQPATQRTSLWLANADGTQALELVNERTFAAVMNPRFSPDGAWLAFTVHGEAQQFLPTVEGDTGCALVLFVFCLARTAHAHSAPGSLWRINLDTKKFQQLTNIYDDSPIAAWSPDGSQIAIHDFTGIRLIDLTRQEIYALFLEDGGAGG